MPTMRRLPVEPLLAFADRQVADRFANPSDIGAPVSLKRTALFMGVHPRQVYRWLDTGIGVFQADRIAADLGCHPNDIWGEDWWSVEACRGHV